MKCKRADINNLADIFLPFLQLLIKKINDSKKKENFDITKSKTLGEKSEADTNNLADIFLPFLELLIKKINNSTKKETNSLAYKSLKLLEEKKNDSNPQNLISSINNYDECINLSVLKKLTFSQQKKKENFKTDDRKIYLIKKEKVRFDRLKDSKMIEPLSGVGFALCCEKKLIIKDSNFEKELRSRTFDSPISCISKLTFKNCNGEESNKFILVSLEDGQSFELELTEFNSEKYDKPSKLEANIKSAKFFFEIKINKYIISNIEGTFYYKNDPGNIKLEKISEESFKIGKVINERYVLLINNGKDGKGILKYFDIKSEKINVVKKFDHSFILSQNCIDLMNLKKDDSTIKALICSYEKSHGKGILVVKLKFRDDELLINELFYYNYELENCKCINCLFIIKQKNNNNDNIILENKKIDTFLLMASVINENDESEFRTYSLEDIENLNSTEKNENIKKEYIKSRIDDNDCNKQVICVNQLYNDYLAINLIDSSSELIITKICKFK